MKEGLLGPTVENVGFAVVEETVENEKIYNVYLLNMRQDIMEGIIVTSTGYGESKKLFKWKKQPSYWA